MRVQEIDIARGFTVFIMTAVHAVLIYSTPSVHTSWLGNILFFLAEGPGAPIFMSAMGISFVLARKKPIKQHLKRAALLFALAYLLNTLKFLVPIYTGTMPAELYTDFGIPPGQAGTLHFFLLGDILQLASISLIILALLYQLPNYHYWAMILAAIILITTPYLWSVQHNHPLVNYIFSLAWGYNAQVYFPVFPWLVYPLVGMAAGHYLQTVSNFFPKATIIGILFMSTGLLISATDPAFHWGDFYRTAQGGTLYYTGFLLVWLYCCHLTVRFIPPNAFFNLLTDLSRHITLVYFVQWILIFWLIGVIGYRQLNLASSLVCMTLFTCLVIMISLGPAKMKLPMVKMQSGK